MSIEEFKNILENELQNGNEDTSSIMILKAQQELLKDENNKKENFEILSSLKGYSLREQVEMLNNYLNQNNSGMSNNKGMSYTLNNPSVPKLFTDERDGHINIILLSISLIVLAVIIFAIIFA